VRYFRLIEDLAGRSPLGFGLGAGRWNEFGTPIIYRCNAASLTFLELLSIKGAVITQSKWKLVVLEIPENGLELDASHVPSDWKNRPHSRSTQEFGTAWAKGMISPVLKIPSCRIPPSSYPNEYNILINPLHPDFRNSVKLVEELDVSFEVNS
jgi:RES domain-containing protein